MDANNHNQDLINNLREESEEEKIIFFNKVLDLLKWTLTISFGSFLWIGSIFVNNQNSTSQINISLFLIISLLFFGFSILISLGIFIKIIEQLAEKVNSTINHFESLKENIGNETSGNVLDKKRDVVDEKSKASEKLLKLVSLMKFLIYSHLICMCGGVVFFIYAIFLCMKIELLF